VKAVAFLSILVVLLPFESMKPIAQRWGFEVSSVELAALILLSLSAAAIGPRGISKLTPSLFLLIGFVVACLVSALFAEGPISLPLKFTLRMMAGIVAAVLTFHALRNSPNFASLFRAFTVAGVVSAGLILLEVSNVSLMSELVAPFREQSFEVGGRYRASGTFSYPNIAAGFLALCLPFTLYFVANEREQRQRRTQAFAVFAALAVFAAILLTYSRGALLGATAASGLVCWNHRSTSLTRVLVCFALLALALVAIEPSFRWRAASEDDRTWYAVDVAPEEETLTLSPGEMSSTEVTLTNSGKLIWDSTVERPFHLSYRWFRFETNDGFPLEPLPIEGARTRLSHAVKPGARIKLSANVVAPESPGRYLLIWDMVHEHTTWFSDKVGLGSPVSVRVGSSSDVAPKLESPPRKVREWISERSWRPGRWELWGIALTLFASRPILGAGPDNFRWLYGPVTGHDYWDTRVYSNSLYLELLATVGVLGFAVFALAMGKTLVSLRRSRRAHGLRASVLEAALLGFLVHGVFDYLLAPTTMYLAFFILMGASAAIGRTEAPA
jgi:O-antigen ligase